MLLYTMDSEIDGSNGTCMKKRCADQEYTQIFPEEIQI